MTHLTHRPWVPAAVESYIQDIASQTAAATSGDTEARLNTLIGENRQIH